MHVLTLRRLWPIHFTGHFRFFTSWLTSFGPPFSHRVPFMIFSGQKNDKNSTHTSIYEDLFSQRSSQIDLIFWTEKIITKKKIWEKGALKLVSQEIKNRKCQWIGHILWRVSTYINSIALERQPGNENRKCENRNQLPLVMRISRGHLIFICHRQCTSLLLCLHIYYKIKFLSE